MVFLVRKQRILQDIYLVIPCFQINVSIERCKLLTVKPRERPSHNKFSSRHQCAARNSLQHALTC
jgi:hypothetical protein